MTKSPKVRIPTRQKLPCREAKNSLIGRLRNSDLFRSYREIFRNSTGLPLDLQPIGSQYLESGFAHKTGGSMFCQLLNGGGNCCLQCTETHSRLSTNEARGVQSIRCFAGLSETAVPVMYGGAVIAQLMTGHIFHKRPSKEDFQEVIPILGESADRGVKLEKAYLETPVIKQEKYRAMTTLLAAFSLQLGDLARQIALELRHEKSDAIACVKDYIDEHIYDPIILDEVAAEVHMSRYYLCRRFKQSTGMTLTEYITGYRVEMARHMLKNSTLRVADIAFEVGFQSLSQFNRCFLRITQITPTKFRKAAHAN